MEALKKAKEIYEGREKWLSDIKKRQKIFGYFCCQIPLEFLAALSICPARIFGDTKEPPEKGDFYIEAVTCGYIRSVFDIMDKGRYRYLDGIIGCRSCQGIEISFDLFRYYFRPNYAYHLDVPHKITDWARDFFKKEILDFKRDLEVWAKREIKEDELRRAIELLNEQRRLLKRLYEFRKYEPPKISGKEILEVLCAIMSMNIQEGNDFLEKVLEELFKRESLPKKSFRVMLWGSIVDCTPLIELIEECDAYVVIDDTCVGSRFFWSEVERTEDPIDGLVKRYLYGVPCPRTFKNDPNKSYEENLDERFSYLKEFVTDFYPDGAILQITRYCDTHGWEVPDIKHYFEDRLNIPTLFVEHDYNALSLAPLKTRIEAFLERIGEEI